MRKRLLNLIEFTTLDRLVILKEVRCWVNSGKESMFIKNKSEFIFDIFHYAIRRHKFNMTK